MVFWNCFRLSYISFSPKFFQTPKITTSLSSFLQLKMWLSLAILLLFVAAAVSCPVVVTVSGYENWSYFSSNAPCYVTATNTFCSQKLGFSIKVADAGVKCSSKCYSSDSLYIGSSSVTYYNSEYDLLQMGLIGIQGSCYKYSSQNSYNLQVQVCTNTTA